MIAAATGAGLSTKKLWSLSPRLGMSFPITRASKLFVNYGHFRSMPNPNDLYQVRFFSPAMNEQVRQRLDERLIVRVGHSIGM